MGIVAALLKGPEWRSNRPPKTKWALAALPMLALVVCGCLIAGPVLLRAFAAAGIGGAINALPVAAGGSLLCLSLAIPAAIVTPRIPWLLAAWLAVSIGGAGCSLIAAPETPLAKSARVAVLLLPLMVLGLAGALSAVPGGLAHAAAAAGGGPLTSTRLLARACWPSALRVTLVVFALSLTLK